MWVGYAEMAAAVSNAGGLGILVGLSKIFQHLKLMSIDGLDTTFSRGPKKRVSYLQTFAADWAQNSSMSEHDNKTFRS
jgi:hypothetical protein